MITATTAFFVATTIALWFACVWRMGYRRYSYKLNSFFLGLIVMSFVGIWVSAVLGR